MNHPSFHIISKLGLTPLCKPDAEALRSFTEQVWHMQVYIPGKRVDLPDRRTATHFSLNQGVDKAFACLPVYVRETDAVRAHGPDGYFPARFHLALLFAESYRADAQLIDGRECLHLAHEKLLELRDLVGLGHERIPLAGDEAATQRATMLAFATRARAYCSRQADVQSLHLATLPTIGIKCVLVGALSAGQYARHALALQEISMDVFRPGWRFVLLEEARGHAALISDVLKTPPCYLKVGNQSWWSKVMIKFMSPAPPLTGLTLKQAANRRDR